MADEVPNPPEPPGGDAPQTPPLPVLPPEVLSSADELRQQVDAGAASPEELRALAARLREQRELEEAAWRSEVRPALMQAKKRKFRLRDVIEQSEGPTASAGIAAGLFLVVLALVVAATQSTPLWLAVPVVGVLGYAYRQGRREQAAPAPPAEPTGDGEDAPD